MNVNPSASGAFGSENPAPLGRRGQNKLAKEDAIRTAAKRLFADKGYEATTLREIAKAAGVGFGTVFEYSKDKSGLLAMIFVEQLNSLPPLFDGNTPDMSLEDELIKGLGHLYAFWATVPNLSRHVLQQMEFYASNPYMESIVLRRQEARSELADWIARGQAEGRIAADADAARAAATLFAIYTSAVREWAATAPGDVEQGLERLRALVELPLKALRP
jgi:AcrR family transcriptional regulator